MLKKYQYAFYKKWVLIKLPDEDIDEVVNQIKGIEIYRRCYLPDSELWAITYPAWRYHKMFLFDSTEWRGKKIEVSEIEGVVQDELDELPEYANSYSHEDKPSSYQHRKQPVIIEVTINGNATIDGKSQKKSVYQYQGKPSSFGFFDGRCQEEVKHLIGKRVSGFPNRGFKTLIKPEVRAEGILQDKHYRGSDAAVICLDTGELIACNTYGIYEVKEKAVPEQLSFLQEEVKPITAIKVDEKTHKPIKEGKVILGAFKKIWGKL